MNPIELSTNELISRLLACYGNQERQFNLFFTELIRRHKRMVENLFVKRCNQEDYVQIPDFVQTTFTKLLERDAKYLRDYRGQYENSFLPYLKTIALSVLSSSLRYGDAQKRIPKNKVTLMDQPKRSGGEMLNLHEVIENREALLSIESVMLKMDIKHCIVQYLRTLQKNRQRNALILQLKFFNDMDAEEIANHPDIDLSFQSIYRIITDASNAIQDCLNQEKEANE